MPNHEGKDPQGFYLAFKKKTKERKKEKDFKKKRNGKMVKKSKNHNTVNDHGS